MYSMKITTRLVLIYTYYIHTYIYSMKIPMHFAYIHAHII